MENESEKKRQIEVFHLAISLIEELREIPATDGKTIVGFENYISSILEDISCTYTTAALFLISLFGQPQGRTGELVVSWIKHLRNSGRQAPTSRMTMTEFTRAMITFLQAATFTLEVVHSTNVFYIELFHTDPCIPPLRLDRMDLTPLEQLCITHLLKCVHDDNVSTTPWSALIESQTECRKVTYKSFTHASLMNPSMPAGEFLRNNLVFVFVSAFYAGIQQQFCKPSDQMVQTLWINSFLQTCNDCARATRQRNEKRRWRVVNVHTNQLVERTKKMRQRAAHLSNLASIMDTVSDAMIASADVPKQIEPQAAGPSSSSLAETTRGQLVKKAGVPERLAEQYADKDGGEISREARSAEAEASKMERVVRSRKSAGGTTHTTTYTEYRLSGVSAEEKQEENVEASIARAAIDDVTSAIVSCKSPVNIDEGDAVEANESVLLKKAVRVVSDDTVVRVEGAVVIEELPGCLFEGALRNVGTTSKGLFWNDTTSGVTHLFSQKPEPLPEASSVGHLAHILDAQPFFYCD